MSYAPVTGSLVKPLARCLVMHGSMEGIAAAIKRLEESGKDATTCEEFICTHELYRRADPASIIAEAHQVAADARIILAKDAAIPKRQVYLQSWWFLGAAVWCLILALTTFRGYWIYDVSRLFVSTIALLATATVPPWARWFTLPLVVLFNPFVPVHMGRDIWQVVDAAASVILLCAAFGTREIRDSR